MKLKWKSVKDAFTRYRRLLKEGRSGAGGTGLAQYVHAEELQFLVPIMEMRSTESSWPAATCQPEPGHAEGAEDEQQDPDVDAPDLDSSVASAHCNPTPLEEAAGNQATQAGTIRGRTTRRADRRADRGGDHGQRMEMLVSIMSSIAEHQIRHTPEVLFALGLVHLMERVEPQYKGQMQSSLTALLTSYIPPTANDPTPLCTGSIIHGPYERSQPSAPAVPQAAHTQQYHSQPPYQHTTYPPSYPPWSYSGRHNPSWPSSSRYPCHTPAPSSSDLSGEFTPMMVSEDMAAPPLPPPRYHDL